MSEASTVLIATISSTAKVYVVGAVGYLCTKIPRESPLLPKRLVGMTSRLAFNLFTIALIYSSIASTLSVGVMMQYWFVPISGLVIITLSYIIATLTAYLPCFCLENPLDFEALRIAASFPNIVALPILIFPTLCEFDVVHQAFTTLDPYNTTPTEMAKDCAMNATTMIFAYFLSWSCLFFCFAHQKLVNCGRRRQDQYVQPSYQTDNNVATNHENDNTVEYCLKYAKSFVYGIRQAFLSPGIIAMVLAVVTACIPPLQSALFSPGGALRFLGSAIQSLGDASPALSTLVVAASLNVSPIDEISTVEQQLCTTSPSQFIEGQEDNQEIDSDLNLTIEAQTTKVENSLSAQQSPASPATLMSDPVFGGRRQSSIYRLAQELSKRSIRIINFTKIKPSLKMHIWFNLSRLILSPAIILLILLTLECTTAFISDVPPLAKLVVLINSALPGAQIVVIVLKSIEATETSAVVARVYIFHYLLTAVTITGWASLGLILFSPKDSSAIGDSLFCPWKK